MKASGLAISLLTHPLLIITYGLVLILLIDPYSFGSTSIRGEIPLLLMTIAYSVLFPLLALILMRLIGFIESIQLHEKRERIGPLMVTIVCYTWLYANFKNNPDIPQPFTHLVLGTVISLGLCFFVTIFEKISLHAAGLGGFAGFILMLIIGYQYQWIRFGLLEVQLIVMLWVIIFLAGLVMSLRIRLGAHTPSETYVGIVVGLLGQLLAGRFLL